MLEDKMLLWQFRHGSDDAFRHIYDKYKNDLLGLAIALSHDRTAAEDALQDVFVSFAQRADKVHLKTSLKSYLSTCIANKVRDIKRKKSIQTVELDQAGGPPECESAASPSGELRWRQGRGREDYARISGGMRPKSDAGRRGRPLIPQHLLYR